MCVRVRVCVCVCVCVCVHVCVWYVCELKSQCPYAFQHTEAVGGSCHPDVFSNELFLGDSTVDLIFFTQNFEQSPTKNPW